MVSDNSSTPELYPCPSCSRTFLETVLEKHLVICEKTKKKKRKVFDSSKQRTENIDLGPVQQQQQQQQNQKTNKSAKKSSWKEKHEEFLKTIRAAKAVDKAIKNGEAPPPVPRSKIPLDYTQCPYCERHFSEKAADRHINWCKDQKSRIKNESKSHEATKRLKARTKYQAPLPGKKLPSPLKTNSSPKHEQKLEESSRLIESAKLTVRSLGIPVKSSKAKSSPAVISRNSATLKKLDDNGFRLPISGSRKLEARKEQLDKKMGIKNNPLKDVRQAKNVFPISSISQKLPGARDERFFTDRSSVDDMVLDSYQFNERALLRCSKPFGTMAPRTVPGVRTNSKMKRNSLNNSTSNGLGYHYDSMASSYYHRVPDGLTPDEEDIDEIDISRHNNNYTRRSPSPGKQNRSFKSSGAFTSYKRNSTLNGNARQGSDSDTRGSTSGSDSSLPPLSYPRSGEELYRLPRYCHACGTKYPIAAAKFCCECGIKRFSIDSVTT